MALTLASLSAKRIALLAERAEYEAEGAMAEFCYNLNCLHRAEKLIKAGMTVTTDELYELG